MSFEDKDLTSCCSSDNTVCILFIRVNVCESHSCVSRHIAKYCRKRKASGIKGEMRTKQTNTTRNNEDQRSGSIGVSKFANEAGMFIKSKVNGRNANMLVDTGILFIRVNVCESHSCVSMV
jgi:predicted aspartyl protease